LRFVFLQPHQKSWPTDGTLDWLWPAAERAGVPLALLAADFLPLVGESPSAIRAFKLIVDHLGRPHRTKGRSGLGPICRSSWRSRSIPNVAVKATGAPSYSSEPYPFRNLHPTSPTPRAFGPERLFWGPTSRACRVPGGSA